MAYTPQEPAASIAALGPIEGREVMIHASLRKLGPVDGSATGALEALRLALGHRARPCLGRGRRQLHG